jgi:hypothetical protein
VGIQKCGQPLAEKPVFQQDNIGFTLFQDAGEDMAPDESPAPRHEYRSAHHECVLSLRGTIRSVAAFRGKNSVS